MSGTIWLIVEGQFDGEIVKAILKRRYPQVSVRVLKPTGNTPSISRLAKQITRLIQEALASRQRGDCIAVLHDADLQIRPHDRADYERIEKVCREYKTKLKHIIAHDELESWLLSDSGLCSWLDAKAQNWDERPQPSNELVRLLDKAQKPKWRESNLPKILANMDASGDQFSKSMRDALNHLENAPCTRE